MRTSKADFRYFVDRCEHWSRVFGLNDWRIAYRHEHTVDDALASYWCSQLGKIASIILEPDWEEEPVAKVGLNRVAMHEVAHVMLSELVAMAEENVAEHKVGRAVHTVIRRLEKVLCSGKIA